MSDDVKRMKANRLVAGKRCGWCHTALELGEDAAICRECRLLHHAGCWDERRGCARPGCVHAPLPQVEAPAVAGPRPRGRGGRARPRAGRGRRGAGPRPRARGRRTGRLSGRLVGQTLRRKVNRARMALLVVGVLYLLLTGCQALSASRQRDQIERMRDHGLIDRDVTDAYFRQQAIQRTITIAVGVVFLVLCAVAGPAPFAAFLTGAILMGLWLLLSMIGLLAGAVGELSPAVLVVALVVFGLMGVAEALFIGGARAAAEMARERG
jgi:hypothetical protein